MKFSFGCSFSPIQFTWKSRFSLYLASSQPHLPSGSLENTHCDLSCGKGIRIHGKAGLWPGGIWASRSCDAKHLGLTSLGWALTNVFSEGLRITHKWASTSRAESEVGRLWWCTFPNWTGLSWVGGNWVSAQCWGLYVFCFFAYHGANHCREMTLKWPKWEQVRTGNVFIMNVIIISWLDAVRSIRDQANTLHLLCPSAVKWN